MPETLAVIILVVFVFLVWKYSKSNWQRTLERNTLPEETPVSDLIERLLCGQRIVLSACNRKHLIRYDTMLFEDEFLSCRALHQVDFKALLELAASRATLSLGPDSLFTKYKHLIWSTDFNSKDAFTGFRILAQKLEAEHDLRAKILERLSKEIMTSGYIEQG